MMTGDELFSGFLVRHSAGNNLMNDVQWTYIFQGRNLND